MPIIYRPPLVRGDWRQRLHHATTAVIHHHLGVWILLLILFPDLFLIWAVKTDQAMAEHHGCYLRKHFFYMQHTPKDTELCSLF